MTYPGDEVVDKDQNVANHGEAEQVLELGRLRDLDVDLVVADHGRCGSEVCQRQGSKDHQVILSNELPWRVAGSKEHGLQTGQRRFKNGHM